MKLQDTPPPALSASASLDADPLYQEVQRLTAELQELRRYGQEVERRYRGLIDRLDAIFWEADVASFDFTYVSPRAESLLGYSMERWLEHAFWERILHPEDHDWVVASCAEATAACRDNEIVYRVLAADGRVVWLQDMIYVEADEAGHPRQLRGVMLDVTAQKSIEEALRATSAAKDQFLAMLAHELRNPLGAVSNALQVVRSCPPGTPAWSRAMEVVDRQVRHQVQILNDLLEVSRLSRGKVEVKREVLDLCRLVEQTVEDSRGALRQAGLSLVLALPREAVRVEGDPTQLAQVVVNLLNNAIKFTEPGGRVEVRVAEDREVGKVTVTVADSGIGITPDMLPQVWEVFSQADQSLERSRGGLGLGLALVKGLVELHGGEVRAASDGPGRGAALTFGLPVVAGGPDGGRGEARPEPQAADPGAGRPLRVLVVEDNRDAAETLGDLLRIFGHEVELAHTGPDGIEAARGFHPEVVLCDIGLPGMDGYAVAEQLRSDPDTTRCRLVALTGYGRDSDRRRAEEAGFDLHLVKPVEPEQLQRLLETWSAGG